MSKWQSMESAPKDGTVIIYCNASVTLGVCRWRSAESIAAEEGGSAEDFQASWYSADDDMDEVCPSQWMPLPDAMIAQRDKEGAS